MWPLSKWSLSPIQMHKGNLNEFQLVLKHSWDVLVVNQLACRVNYTPVTSTSLNTGAITQLYPSGGYNEPFGKLMSLPVLTDAAKHCVRITWSMPKQRVVPWEVGIRPWNKTRGPAEPSPKALLVPALLRSATIMSGVGAAPTLRSQSGASQQATSTQPVPALGPNKSTPWLQVFAWSASRFHLFTVVCLRCIDWIFPSICANIMSCWSSSVKLPSVCAQGPVGIREAGPIVPNAPLVRVVQMLKVHETVQQNNVPTGRRCSSDQRPNTLLHTRIVVEYNYITSSISVN